MSLTKKLLAIIAFVGFSSFAYSTPPEDPVMNVKSIMKCSSIEYAVNLIEKEYGEFPVLVSDYDPEDNSQDILFWNKRTKTFSMIEMRMAKQADGKTEKQMACMIATGTMKFDLKALADRRS